MDLVALAAPVWGPMLGVVAINAVAQPIIRARRWRHYVDKH